MKNLGLLVLVAAVMCGGMIPGWQGIAWAHRIRADFNGDGFEDLAVGVPDESIGSKESAGAVSVIFGSAIGLKSLNNQFWHQEAGERGEASGCQRLSSSRWKG